MTNAQPGETEQQRDERRKKEDIDKRKAKLKKAANNADETARLLAQSIVNAGGNTRDDLEATISAFESGGVDATPDANDTPYGLPRDQRPKVVILQENLPKKADVIPPKKKG